MASTFSSSLLLLFIFFITTPLHSIAFSSSQYSTETDLHENPDLKSGSKASNGGGGGDSTKLWCVAKNNADDASLQASLDWACGQGGTDCGPIQQGGPCYNPDDFQSTASYAFNDYFQRNGMTEESCNFANTAALTSLNPSHGNCQFPTRARVVVNEGFNAGSATGVVGGGGRPSGVSDDTSDGGSSQIGRRRLWWWVQASLITGVLIFTY